MEYFTLFLKKLLRYLLKPLSFLPALLMMYLIFSFSAQPGTASGSLSLKVSKLFVLAYNRLFLRGMDNASLNELIVQIHPYVRKLAHVTEYFLLAVSVSFPLYVYRLRGFLLVIIAGAFCVSFAALDEYHQSFIIGRVASGRDVLIDSIGIIIGIILVRIVGYIGRKTIFAGLSLDKKQAKTGGHH